MRIRYVLPALLSAMLLSCSDNIDLSDNIQNDGLDSKSYLELAYESNSLANKIESAISSQSRSGESSYPDYFGGLYIDSNGYLVVLSKGDINTTRSSIEPMSEGNPIKFVSCKYSYQELLDVMSELNNIFSVTNNEITENVTGYAILTEDNVVEIALEDCTQAAIDKFKRNILDKPCLSFVKGERPVYHSSSSFGPGTMSILKHGSKYYAGSYSFRVKQDKLVGMVTSGHVASLGDTVMSGKTEAVKIGTCIKSQVSGSIDAAFVSITSDDYSLVNTIGDTKDELSTGTMDPKVGFPVTLCGQHCLSGVSGTIKSITYSTKASNGSLLTNLSYATYKSQNGDSGGIVYGKDNTTNNAVGVNMGETVVNKTTYGFYCKASEVLKALGVTRY